MEFFFYYTRWNRYQYIILKRITCRTCGDDRGRHKGGHSGLVASGRPQCEDGGRPLWHHALLHLLFLHLFRPRLGVTSHYKYLIYNRVLNINTMYLIQSIIINILRYLIIKNRVMNISLISQLLNHWFLSVVKVKNISSVFKIMYEQP